MIFIASTCTRNSTHSFKQQTFRLLFLSILLKFRFTFWFPSTVTFDVVCMFKLGLSFKKQHIRKIFKSPKTEYHYRFFSMRHNQSQLSHKHFVTIRTTITSRSVILFISFRFFFSRFRLGDAFPFPTKLRGMKLPRHSSTSVKKNE